MPTYDTALADLRRLALRYSRDVSDTGAHYSSADLIELATAEYGSDPEQWPADVLEFGIDAELVDWCDAHSRNVLPGKACACCAERAAQVEAPTMPFGIVPCSEVA